MLEREKEARLAKLASELRIELRSQSAQALDTVVRQSDSVLREELAALRSVIDQALPRREAASRQPGT